MFTIKIFLQGKSKRKDYVCIVFSVNLPIKTCYEHQHFSPFVYDSNLSFYNLKIIILITVAEYILTFSFGLKR